MMSVLGDEEETKKQKKKEKKKETKKQTEFSNCELSWSGKTLATHLQLVPSI